jgi:hypothetical protein
VSLCSHTSVVWYCAYFCTTLVGSKTLLSFYATCGESVQTLSPQKTTRVLTTLSLLKRPLALSPHKSTRSFSSEVPVSLLCSPPPAARAMRIALSLLRKLVLQQADRSRARRQKGLVDVDRDVIQSRHLHPLPLGPGMNILAHG